MRLRTVVGYLSVLVLWSGGAWAQGVGVGTPITPGGAPPAPSCESQVSDLYRKLVTDRQVYEVPSATWPQQLTAITSQLRIVTTQYEMQQGETQRTQGQAAMHKEVGRQLQEQVQSLQQQLAEAQARVKELEGQGPTPTAAR